MNITLYSYIIFWGEFFLLEIVIVAYLPMYNKYVGDASIANVFLVET